MKPYYQDNHTTQYCANFLDNELEDESVQMVVTSPPYWGLRKYSGEQDLIWGDNDCRHEWGNQLIRRDRGTAKGATAQVGNQLKEVSGVETNQGSYCQVCGAWKGAFGLEPTPEMYVEHTIEILREIRRVLRKDGVVFLNLGDSYAGSGKGIGSDHGKAVFSDNDISKTNWGAMKPKDLCLIPFRVAIAAQKPYYAGRIKNELDRVWMAAMIDSEGTVCGFRHERPDGNIRTGVLVFVTNGDENILNNCDRIWPGSRYIESLKAGDKVMGATAVRDCWRWQIQKAEDRALFLREIYPYMVAKKLQVMVGWNLNEYSLQAKKMGRGGESKDVKAKREVLAKILSDLNQHKPVDIPKWVKEPPSVVEPGWYVRSVIVWSKNNPMPESVQDRPTESHEYILMLTKSAKYYWDADAVREPARDWGDRNRSNWSPRVNAETYGQQPHTGGERGDFAESGRNIRTVWEFPTQPFPEAHFAVFPEKLPETCIKAASKEDDIVLDSFSGSGTTLWVAKKLNRKAIGFEISQEYCDLAVKRNRQQVIM